MGMVVARLVRVEPGARPGHARDRARVAPTRFPVALDVEESLSRRLSARRGEHACVDSSDGGREPAVGRAAHPWGVAEAGGLGQSIDGRQVHAAATTQVTVAVMAHLPGQPRQPDHGR